MNASEADWPRFPVENGVWVVVFGDLLLFTLLFVTFLFYRSDSVEVFERSRTMLSQELGALNTIVLLTGSWFVASAVKHLSSMSTSPIAINYLRGAFVCGIIFLLVKAIEYGSVISNGLTVLTNDFFMFYFMLTGIHLLHVIVGTTLLLAATIHLSHRINNEQKISQPLIGFASSFWHMLDLLWIVLFPLLYLLQ